MRSYVAAVYLFLYAPIALIVVFSFNAGRYAADLQGFSTAWYGRALANPFVLEALRTSLIVGLSSAVLATLFGTMAAMGLQSLRGALRNLFDGLVYVALMIPGIVIGIATLVALVSLFDLLNPVLAAVWPAMLGGPPQLQLGLGSLIAAHTLFTMALAVLIVRSRLAGMDRSLIEASMDLYATPWGTFRQITLPQLLPAIIASLLLAFTFSFDDFVIAFFVAGANTTLPIYVFSSIRRGVTPEINAIGTMVLAVSLGLMIAAQLLLRWRQEPAVDGR
jgi:spermidine/putrescine transport system permease protein